MTLGSLFDGIGTWLLSATHNNIKPVWSCEIDDFPSAVSNHHFPDVKQYGDITKVSGYEVEPVDIICAGSPCQDLSVAGKRAGLAGKRSGLFMEAMRIVREMRDKTNGEKPRYFVWENVPGAFSSNRGLDFGAVLEEISQTEIPMPQDNKWAPAGMVEWDGGSLAWRVLDAQYWGVPQRRKRIFLVASFGTDSAGEILFECQGLSGDSEESQGKRQATSGNAGGSSGETVGAVGFDGYNSALTGEKAATIGVNCGMSTGHNGILHTGGTPDSSNTANKLITCYNMGQPSNNFEPYTEGGGVSPTLISRMGTGGNQVPIIDSHNLTVFENRHDEGVRLVTGDKSNTITAAMGEGGGNVPLVHTYAKVASTLRAGAGAPKHMSDIKGRIVQSFALQGNMIGRKLKNGPQGDGINEEVSFTLNTIDRHAVCYSFDSKSSNSMKSSNPHSGCRAVEVAKCLDTTVPDPSKNQGGIAVAECYSIGHDERAAALQPNKADTLMASDYKQPPIVNEPYQKSVGSLCADDYKGINNQYVSQDKCIVQKSVRKLTPKECERLQGLPDGWTDIEFKGKPAPDNRRYKAIGNGMAVPCSDYVLGRICSSAH